MTEEKNKPTTFMSATTMRSGAFRATMTTPCMSC